MVSGKIEVVYPFDDPVGLIMNEEGKLLGLTPNRALKDNNGRTYDIIFGNFSCHRSYRRKFRIFIQ